MALPPVTIVPDDELDSATLSIADVDDEADKHTGRHVRVRPRGEGTAGEIIEIGEASALEHRDGERALRLPGTLLPGLIDLQCNGIAGRDVADAVPPQGSRGWLRGYLR